MSVLCLCSDIFVRQKGKKGFSPTPTPTPTTDTDSVQVPHFSPPRGLIGSIPIIGLGSRHTQRHHRPLHQCVKKSLGRRTNQNKTDPVKFCSRMGTHLSEKLPRCSRTLFRRVGRSPVQDSGYARHRGSRHRLVYPAYYGLFGLWTLSQLLFGVCVAWHVWNRPYPSLICPSFGSLVLDVVVVSILP